MADLIEFATFFDIEVDEFARLLALIAAHRLGRFERTEPIEAEPPENPAHSCRRDRELRGNLLAAMALAAQRLDGGACGRRGLARR
jgi:hypothetical protein